MCFFLPKSVYPVQFLSSEIIKSFHLDEEHLTGAHFTLMRPLFLLDLQKNALYISY